MARIVINIVQRTPRRPCRIDVRMDGSSRDSVAERNLMEEIYSRLKEKWSVGGIDDRRAEAASASPPSNPKTTADARAAMEEHEEERRAAAMSRKRHPDARLAKPAHTARPAR